MLAELTTATIGRRYRLLDQLGVGGMGVVYHALDRLTGKTIALKRVLAPTEQLLFASRSDSTDHRLALAQEFQSLATLRHPHVIAVRDYGFDDERQPFFTMDLLENAKTIVQAGEGQPLQVQIDYLVQTLQALAYLHRRGIIHRDLKPGNILVTDGQVKVLDFGLSMESHKAMGTSGTVAYMAPEMLSGGTASPASDLYAIGVIAYEMFTGTHPFDAVTLTTLINQVMNKTPDLAALGIDPRLRLVLEQLLAKSADARFADAGLVIEAFSAALDQPLSLETKATRESFLQANRLIGRDNELAQLSVALIRAGASQSSLTLVGGESGIGKSRLLDELRTLALIRGIEVLRGQAINRGGGLYQVWRNIVRWLVLLTDITDLEASVLKALVPDIGMLLERPVSDAPELDPKAAQTRLLSVMADVMRRVQQPTVILLEDLQWAGSESLMLLSWLVRSLPDSPILFLGSFRDDESPDLPASLPTAQVLKLARLSEHSIAQLSESMLGVAGSQPQLVELLQKETEGNVFFLIEVVRALAEEAGQLDKISSMSLPANVFAGGIQRIVQRRLSRVPLEAQDLLKLAAIAGRQLDLEVLKATQATSNLENWLTICVNAAVLDFQDGRWRFAHDKLREGLLGNLLPDQRYPLHKRVALALETAYPNDPNWAAALAYQWAMAGNTEKEAYYSEAAGLQSLRNGANQDAITFLSRALELDTKLHKQNPSPADKLHWARIERQLGEAQLGLGKLNECMAHMQKTIGWLGYREPEKRGALVMSLLAHVGRQILHRLLPNTFVGRAAVQTDALVEASLAYQRIGELRFYSYNTLATVHAALVSLNIAEQGAPSTALAAAYANMCVIAGLVPLHAIAQSYMTRAKTMVAQFNDPRSTGFVISRTGIYSFGVGNWPEAEQSARDAAENSDRIGDKRQWNESTSILALAYQFQGRFRVGAELLADLYTMAVRSGDAHYQSRGLYWQAQGRLRLGDVDTSLDLLSKSFALLEEHASVGDRGWRIGTHTLTGIAYMHQGERELARQQAETSLDLISSASITAFSGFEGYVGPAEVFLELWETSTDPVERQQLADLAQRACKVAAKYGHKFPIGAARASIWQGCAAWIEGKPANAQKLWQQGLAQAQAIKMPFDEALAYYHMGRHAATQSTSRREYLICARDHFAKLESAYYLDRTEALLKG